MYTKKTLFMIDRYSTPSMTAIWSKEAKYNCWLQVELAICEAHAELGTIPSGALKEIHTKAAFHLDRCQELEKITHHDLMAFVQNLSESIGEFGKYIHLGVTSYDIIDTALGMMLQDSCKILLKSAKKLSKTIADLGQKHAHLPMIGRTHGIHAEPITFGFKLAGWYAEIQRNMQRLYQLQKEVSVGKISGAVGIHAFVSPQLEEIVCQKLGLKPDPVSTQIVTRDRHAHFMNTLALFGATIERIATELRNLQRTEIAEVQESFYQGQTGSSAMPHKQNPWKCETLCGLSRILRSNAQAMMETVMSWHERDLTNSAVERIVLPDSCHLVDFMTNSLCSILEEITINKENIKRNLELLGDLVYSEHLMIALIHAGLSREEAYKLAQTYAKASIKNKDFQQQINNDPTISSLLTDQKMFEIFSLKHHLRHVDHSLRIFSIQSPESKE